jgi:hypothetical protein
MPHTIKNERHIEIFYRIEQEIENNCTSQKKIERKTKRCDENNSLLSRAFDSDIFILIEVFLETAPESY